LVQASFVPEALIVRHRASRFLHSALHLVGGSTHCGVLLSNVSGKRAFSSRDKESNRSPDEAEVSNDSYQPEHENDHHDASNRNRKVHTNLLREPSILVILKLV
jgi:hypothetical protein